MAGTVVSLKAREPRRHVSVQARMLAGDQWHDAAIHNVSRRGIMATCELPLRRGDYVELGSGGNVIVGRVLWARSGRFALRTQDDVDIEALTAPREPYAGPERRRTPRGAGGRTGHHAGDPGRDAVAESVERSRRLASLLQFAFLVLLALGGALLLVTAVATTLGEPMQRASSAMTLSSQEAGRP